MFHLTGKSKRFSRLHQQFLKEKGLYAPGGLGSAWEAVHFCPNKRFLQGYRFPFGFVPTKI
jgi:hypothetical protein